MSEAGEIYLEAAEHSLFGAADHDVFAENHNEVTEHQDKLSSLSHCMHSHPPLTFMFSDVQITFVPTEIEFGASLMQSSVSIQHRPPTPPPTS